MDFMLLYPCSEDRLLASKLILTVPFPGRNPSATKIPLSSAKGL